MKQPRKWIRRLLLLAAGLLMVFIMLRWFEHAQVFHPDRSSRILDLELRKRSADDVFFPAADETKLNGVYFPAMTNSERKALVVLVCHGNGGNVSHRLRLADALLTNGVNVFLFDYRGYGRSHGRPNEEGTYQDAVGAYEWLKRRGFSPANIIVYGESLGGGVATELACRVQVGGLILQSTFTSIPDIGAELFPWLPVRRMAHIRYDTQSKLPRVKAPVLVMHSRADEIVGIRHAQKNFAAANQPKLFCEIDLGHNAALDNGPRFVAGIDAFLNLLRESPETAPPTVAEPPPP